MKAFFVRLLQVLWVLSLIVYAIGVGASVLFGEMEVIIAWVAFPIIWFIGLIVIQYLVFSKLSPFDLFNGSLLERRYPR
uniref:hypothetical protein n=1 Tax=Psychrobacter sp. TaxID=56811 RepID=UPI0015EFDA26|nr:hypothetical protein [Psychrobacter sp.]